jgi:hypothetical protein
MPLCSYLDRLDEIDLLLAFVVVGAEALPPPAPLHFEKYPVTPNLSTPYRSVSLRRLATGSRLALLAAAVRAFVRSLRALIGS